MTYEEAVEVVKAIASDLEEAESTLSDLSDIETYVDEAKSYLDNALDQLNSIEVPDVSDLDLDGLKDRLTELADDLAGMKHQATSLTLVIKQGSAEQKFFLHPDSPATIEIITE